MIYSLGMKHLSTERSLNFIISAQRSDGSWSGALTSRIRETFLVYILSCRQNWNSLRSDSMTWMKTHEKDLGEIPEEKVLNQAFVNLFHEQNIDLRFPSLYDPNLIRKTLMIFCLAIVCQRSISLPKQYENWEDIYEFLYSYCNQNKGKVKGWAFVELLSCLAIISKSLKKDVSQITTDILSLQDQVDSWFRNPATTAFALIALSFSSGFKSSNYFSFFEKCQQEDRGWSYCEIPLWGTGLTLESLRKIKKPSLQVRIAITKALQYFENNQNPDGGWGFDIALESEADTTSIILHSLPVNIMVQKSLKYFQKLQFKDGEFKGLWPVWRHSEIPSVEVVAHIVSALEVHNSEIPLMDAKKWLQNQISEHLWRADWGRNEPYSINALSQVNGLMVNDLLGYLTKTQNSDGGWGSEKGEVSNPSATANAILALKTSNKYNKYLEKAFQYLVNSQLPEGNWPQVKEIFGPRPFSYGDNCSTNNFIFQALTS